MDKTPREVRRLGMGLPPKNAEENRTPDVYSQNPFQRKSGRARRDVSQNRTRRISGRASSGYRKPNEVEQTAASRTGNTDTGNTVGINLANQLAMLDQRIQDLPKGTKENYQKLTRERAIHMHRQRNKAKSSKEENNPEGYSGSKGDKNGDKNARKGASEVVSTPNRTFRPSFPPRAPTTKRNSVNSTQSGDTTQGGLTTEDAKLRRRDQLRSNNDNLRTDLGGLAKKWNRNIEEIFNVKRINIVDIPPASPGGPSPLQVPTLKDSPEKGGTKVESATSLLNMPSPEKKATIVTTPAKAPLLPTGVAKQIIPTSVVSTASVGSGAPEGSAAPAGSGTATGSTTNALWNGAAVTTSTNIGVASGNTSSSTTTKIQLNSPTGASQPGTVPLTMQASNIIPKTNRTCDAATASDAADNSTTVEDNSTNDGTNRSPVRMNAADNSTTDGTNGRTSPRRSLARRRNDHQQMNIIKRRGEADEVPDEVPITFTNPSIPELNGTFSISEAAIKLLKRCKCSKYCMVEWEERGIRPPPDAVLPTSSSSRGVGGAVSSGNRATMHYPNTAPTTAYSTDHQLLQGMHTIRGAQGISANLNSLNPPSIQNLQLGASTWGGPSPMRLNQLNLPTGLSPMNQFSITNKSPCYVRQGLGNAGLGNTSHSGIIG